MKKAISGLALILIVAGCSDNNSHDGSQNNTSTAKPKLDSAAHSRDSSSPSIENTDSASRRYTMATQKDQKK